MSTFEATTQPGAAVTTEDAFQSFFDNGGLSDAPPRQDDPNGAAQPAARDAATPQPDDANAVANAAAPADAANAPASQDAPEANTPTYASLNELLTAHKIDPESVMALHVTTKIDGKETQVPLSDVLKSYQLEGHINNKSIDLSNQRAAFEQERANVRNVLQQQFQQNQALGNAAMQMLTQDFQRIDWNALRVNNPAEFAALQADFQQRQQAIQNYVQQINQQAQIEAQRQQDTLRQSLAGERDKLHGARPEWRDEATFIRDRDQMTTYARSIGFQDAELSQIHDHRYMLILHDAARFRALQASAPEVLSRVRQAPPMAAPGSRTDVNPKEAQRRSVVDRLNRNPRDVDAQAAAFEYFANQ